MQIALRSIAVIAALILIAPTRGAADERVFRIKNAATAQELEEFATVIRGMTDSPQVSTDAVSRTLAVRGTDDDVALAEWLIGELDDAAARDRPAETRDYRLAGGAEVVRVFYLDGAATNRDLMEVVTTLRSTTDAQRLLVLAAPNAIVFRGDPAKAAMTEWLFNELNEPGNWQAPGERPAGTEARAYQGQGDHDDMVRVFYLAHSIDPQKDMTLIRRKTRIPRVFYCSTPKAMTVRGTAGQIAQVEGMVTALTPRP